MDTKEVGPMAKMRYTHCHIIHDTALGTQLNTYNIKSNTNTFKLTVSILKVHIKSSSPSPEYEGQYNYNSANK